MLPAGVVRDVSPSETNRFELFEQTFLGIMTSSRGGSLFSGENCFLREFTARNKTTEEVVLLRFILLPSVSQFVSRFVPFEQNK